MMNEANGSTLLAILYIVSILFHSLTKKLSNMNFVLKNIY